MDESSIIELKVKTADGDVVKFKVKPTTKMGKILKAYAKSKGTHDVNSYRFMLDGNRINDKLDKTVKQFELENGDQIDAFIEQQGGNDDQEVITIKIKDADGKELSFKIKKKTKLRKVLNAYATNRGVPVSKFKFILDGTRLNLEEDGDKPVKMLEIEDGDQIDAMVEQLGGF